MRKLILGIIALVAVQFAFVTYTMLLKPSAELTDDLAISQPVPTSLELVKIDQVASSPGIVKEPETAGPPVESRNPKTNRPIPIVPERTAKRGASSEIRISKPAFIPGPSNTATRGDFENVVIRYNRNPNALDCPPHEIPKTKKRSYLAKARPVVQKPWEWLKAVGSKLN